MKGGREEEELDMEGEGKPGGKGGKGTGEGLPGVSEGFAPILLSEAVVLG